jgi:hypothetical protein
MVKVRYSYAHLHAVFSHFVFEEQAIEDFAGIRDDILEELVAPDEESP